MAADAEQTANMYNEAHRVAVSAKRTFFAIIKAMQSEIIADGIASDKRCLMSGR